MLDRKLADEVVLVHLRQPRHRRGEEVRLGVGVLSDDDVPLLESQDPLGLEPEGTGAFGDEAVPQKLGGWARTVKLVSELADEADPEREAGTPATSSSRASRYLSASSETSSSVSRWSASRARGPARFNAAALRSR